MSTIHPQIFYDAQSLVNALAPSQERLRTRHALHGRLRELIRSYAGQDFDVDDISMLNYAEDLDIAPLDLMIIDKRHPTGLPPGTDSSNLPDVYYPSRVASFLQDCGLDGVIQSTEVQRRDGITGGWKRGDPPPQSDTGAFRWPRYKRTPKTEIVYPAILEGTTPEPFRLSLPGPTIRHEMNLFHVYGRRNPHLRLMISLIYVWMRSWGVKEMSPRTLCLLLIRFFQEEEVSRLTKAGYSTTVSAEQVKATAHYVTNVWMPFDTGEGPHQPVLLGVSYALFPLSYPPSDFSPFLLQFLRWVVSQRFHHIRTDGDKWPIFRIDNPKIIDARFGNELRNFDETRSPWSRHQLILPDPFALTHNHAFDVHRSTLHYLSMLAETCASLLRSGRPLHTVFGPYYKPEILAEQLCCSCSPSPLQPSAGLAIGFHMERRQYLSDPRMRDELMRLYHTTVPGQMIREKRQRTLAKIASTIQSNFGSEYRIQVFGSTQYGVDGNTSDLDLVVVDPDRMTGFAPDVDLNLLPRIYKISAVSTVLWKSGFQILQKVPNATVPIGMLPRTNCRIANPNQQLSPKVKFKDPSTDIQCDLNINDQLGSVNTSLIQQYCDILPVLRPLLLAIKRWARPLGYNSPAGAPGEPITFSSYALAIMTIGLLQARRLLPNLQEGTQFTEGRIFWLRTKTQGRVQCDARWKTVHDWTPSKTVEVEQALQDWFQYWGHEHDYRNNLMCIRRGGVLPRQIPCSRKEAESLRDGPFSGFPASGKPPRKDKRDNKSLSEAEIEAQAKQASVAAGPHEIEPHAVVVGQDADGAEDELNETHSVVEGDELAEAEDDDSGYVLGGEDDRNEPSQWESHILCVVDPFIRAKNLTGTYQTSSSCTFSGRLPACGIATPFGRKSLILCCALTRAPALRLLHRSQINGDASGQQGGERGGNRGRGRGGPLRGHPRGGAPKSPSLGEAQAT
ncbi:hypothetical protein EDB89DRAFT_2228510 [Lactarius sanguifluus]|nr:hypothetical protein EDB89DRAFT_2228510 [Lactarius sanguifluus]